MLQSYKHSHQDSKLFGYFSYCVVVFKEFALDFKILCFVYEKY